MLIKVCLLSTGSHWLPGLIFTDVIWSFQCGELAPEGFRAHPGGGGGMSMQDSRGAGLKELEGIALPISPLPVTGDFYMGWGGVASSYFAS